MKAYTYKPQECGRDSWPSGELRLESVTQVEHPNDADIFICPGNLSLFLSGETVDKEAIYKLPYLRGRESRHIFLDVSDNFKRPIGMDCMFIRCDARDWMLATEPNTINLAWPVEDYSECIELPEGGFKYDVTFRGWLSTDTRRTSSDACKNHPLLKCDIEQYSDFTGYLHDRTTNGWTPEGLRRRAEFRRGMKESRIALCPESIPGVFPYRFFEAMSAGRVPLLVGSDFVFPFADEIPYSEFIISIPRERAAEASEIANTLVHDGIFTKLSDEDFIEMGRKARKYWESHLDSRKWPSLMQRAVEKQLDKMGVVCS